ncbi:HEXXH motif-containing putative peptide modification protein [Kitasatospora arboriphila]
MTATAVRRSGSPGDGSRGRRAGAPPWRTPIRSANATAARWRSASVPPHWLPGPGRCGRLGRLSAQICPPRPGPSPQGSARSHPWSRTAGGRQVHAAARHAYGALALPLAADGTTLAARIVRGFRTVTFHGVLDLHALCAPADGVRLPSPWRSVPCPPESLLADAHSALAVVEFWGARAGSGQVAGGGPADTARLRLAVWRTRTCQGLTTLAASQALTPAGRRFTERMQEALEPWLVLPLGPTAEALGRATEVRHGR